MTRGVRSGLRQQAVELLRSPVDVAFLAACGGAVGVLALLSLRRASVGAVGLLALVGLLAYLVSMLATSVISEFGKQPEAM